MRPRHRTGVEINGALGDPDDRLDYGQEIVKKICEATGQAKSEFSRLRQFAKQFPTLSDLFEKHPEAKCWSDVKVLLVKKKAKASEPAPSKATENGQSEVAANVADSSSSKSNADDGAAVTNPKPISSTQKPDGKDQQAMVQFILLNLAKTTDNIQKLETANLGEDRDRIIQAAEKLLDVAKNLPKEAQAAA